MFINPVAPDAVGVSPQPARPRRAVLALIATAVVLGPWPAHVQPSAQSVPVVVKTIWGPGGTRRLPVKPPDTVLREVAKDTPGFATPDVTRATTGPTPARAPAEAAQAGSPQYRRFLPAIRGVDPMVASGRNFLIVAQQGEMMFLDKEGNQLASRNGIPGHVGVDDVFGAFTDPGGTYDINKYAGFPQPCDSPMYPDTRGRKFCISEFYDLRVHFDAGADRFVLLAAMRNPVWTEIWQSGSTVYSDKYGACGVYAPPAGEAKALPNPAFCPLARRLQAFGISRTEDPRDGFHIYATTENNHRDWPWATVNSEGNTFVLGARGIEMDQGPALSVFSLEDLRAGSAQPRFYKHYPKQLGTIGRRVAPIVHHGAAAGLGGRTLALSRVDDRTLEIFSLTAPTGQGVAPPIQSTKATLPEGVSLSSWLGAAVYRNGFLYATWAAPPSAVAMNGAWNLRIPIAIVQGKVFVPPVSASTPGYRYRIVGKEGPASAAFHDIASAIAVNADGEVLTSYARRLSDAELEVRYVIWRPGASAPESSVRVTIARVNPSGGTGKIDYSWAVVDPVDDRTFWFAQDYRWSQLGDNTVLVKVPRQ